ncbi:MAG: class I SAM-dependent methyltransferase [Vulcanimicrobiaceae bacterium]|jgi:SAM-dependent methyltransferase
MARAFVPSVALWRTIEARAVEAAFAKYQFQRPILDLGCGEGKFAAIVFPRNGIDVGLDLDDDMIRDALSTGTYASAVRGDGRRFPFADCSFATVFSNSVIEHIDELDPVLREVARVLKPGGRFVATVPVPGFKDGLFVKRKLDSMGLRRAGALYGEAINAKLHHVNLLEQDSWRLRLRSCGLELVDGVPYLGERAVAAWDRLSIEYFIRSRLKLPVPSRSDVVRSAIESPGNAPYGALLVVAEKPDKDASPA